MDGKRPVGRPYEPDMDRRWWNFTDDRMIAGAISGTLTLLTEAQQRRAMQLTASARLYGNMPLMGAMGLSESRIASAYPWTRSTVTYNAIQSAVDTVVSKIAKNKPKPLFITNGADFHVWRKAKKLNRFMDGLFYENRMHDLARVLFRDAAVWGDGLNHIFWDHVAERIRYERILPQEIWIDEEEAQYGDVRQMHRLKPVDRRMLMGAFPEHADEISRARATQTADAQRPSVSDLVTLRESWHLPSGDDAEDGMHVLTLDDLVLTPEDERERKQSFFPIVRCKWAPRMYGFWSQGVAEQVQNLQLELSKLMWIVQRSFHLAGTFKVLLENGSKIVKEHLNNDVGAIINYSGTKPEYITTPIAAVEYFQQILNLKSMIYEQCGISQLSASSQKPAGLNSGAALREYNDIGSDRLMTIGQQYESFHVETGVMSIAIMREALKRRGSRGYKVHVPSGKFLHELDWKDLSLEDDQFRLQCFPVSSLPDEPAGRLQQINEWVQAGWLDPDEGRRLQGVPDLEQVESLQEAQEDVLMRDLDDIVDNGKPHYPEPTDNLPLAEKLTLRYIARGRLMDLESDRLEMLARYLDNVRAISDGSLLGQPQLPPGANAAPLPAGAPAPPQLPAPSDMVPNVPPQLRAA